MNTTHAKRIKASERAQQALLLRLEGYNYREIGEQLSVTRQAAHKMVSKEIEKRRMTMGEVIDEFVFIENERLDMMTRPLWEKISKGHIPSINTMIRIMDRRSKLLGLDYSDRPPKNDSGLSDSISMGDKIVEEMRAKWRPD